MAERFSYSTFGMEQTQVILDAYERTGSYLRASLQEGVFASSATINRLVRKAVEEGVVAKDFARKKGRPLTDRGRIRELLDQYSLATDKQIAPLVGVSEYTIARVRKEKR